MPDRCPMKEINDSRVRFDGKYWNLVDESEEDISRKIFYVVSMLKLAITRKFVVDGCLMTKEGPFRIPLNKFVSTYGYAWSNLIVGEGGPDG